MAESTSDSPDASKTPRRQLSKAMEHMRFAVTVDPAVQQPSTYGVPGHIEPVRKPASARSHDPSNNQKRSDPFQFGSRYLEEGDDIFEFNAWDHVETDDSYKEFAEMQYTKQREAPVNDFDKKRFNSDPAKWWNLFYKNNTANFFKNRKWLFQEFPILTNLTKPDSPPTLMLEVGAGAGNTAYPILALNENPNFKIHACDFSKTAVEVIRNNEAYDNGQKIQADVWDVAGEGEQSLPPGVAEGSVDVVLMIFIFSALAPNQWAQAVRNIYRVLKPGGHVLFRDYGRGDLAQVRFKKGRYLDENFYVRGDGTRVYFFEKEELEQIWGGRLEDSKDSPADEHSVPAEAKVEELESAQTEEEAHEEAAEKAEELDTSQSTAETNNESADISAEPEEIPAFEIESIGVDRRLLVNRQRKLKMYRCWMQAVYRKPGGSRLEPATEYYEPANPVKHERPTTEDGKTADSLEHQQPTIEGDKAASPVKYQQPRTEDSPATNSFKHQQNPATDLSHPKPISAVPSYITSANGPSPLTSTQARDRRERENLYSSIQSSSTTRQPIELRHPNGTYSKPTLHRGKAPLNGLEEEHARDPRDEAGPLTPLATSRPQSPFTQQPTIDFDGLSWPSLGTRERKEATEKQKEERLAKLSGAVKTILECLGEDPQREGLLETPERYAKAMLFFTKGYEENLFDIVNRAVFHEDHDELVIVKDIEVFSLCEHHLVPFMGKMHIGYIPNRRVLGLSKLARIADMFARRLQVQERLTKQVALALSEVLQPQGVAVVMESSHLCMVMRGVEKTTSTTTTSCMLGCMRSRAKTREEFLNLVFGNRR